MARKRKTCDPKIFRLLARCNAEREPILTAQFLRVADLIETGMDPLRAAYKVRREFAVLDAWHRRLSPYHKQVADMLCPPEPVSATYLDLYPGEKA